MSNTSFKKIGLFAFAIIACLNVFAQKNSAEKNRLLNILSQRNNDHLNIQFTHDRWTNAPDSINKRIRGFGRGLSVYFQFDKPFKTSPKWSVAYGVGIGSSNIFFDSMRVGINQRVSAVNNNMPFTVVAPNQPFFKKYKLTTIYAEIPVELKYSLKPENDKNSFKFGLGVKVGQLINAHTKGKNLIGENVPNTVGRDYIEKISDSRTHFNRTRLMLTARAGYGKFGIIANYQINRLLKDGSGPEIRPLQLGLFLSGL